MYSFVRVIRSRARMLGVRSVGNGHRLLSGHFLKWWW